MISPRYTREIPQRYRLEGGRCKNCGKIAFPPRLICQKCKGEDFEKVSISKRGKILTYTVVHVSPEQFSAETPYVIGIIETSDGVRLMSQIVDCSPQSVQIGKEVEFVFRRIQKEGKAGILCYGYKCRLLDS
ncbi:MAG: Zn-ribbon domain-containing OB-fold protein [Fidelibacterota bacterium]